MIDFHRYFEYRDGALIWKPRDSSFFPVVKRLRNYHNVWNGKNAGRVAGLLENNGYIRIRVDGEKLSAHRIIWMMHNGDIPDGMDIDHINGVRHDNRIENLRLATRKENSKNRTKLSKANTSGVSGVYFCNTRKRWMAHKKLSDCKVQKICRSFEEAVEVIHQFDKEHGITISK